MMMVTPTTPTNQTLHAVWAGEAGSGISTALMETLATAIAQGQLLAESAWVLLPQQALVAPWKQRWQTVAKQHGMASSLGVRVLTHFEWQLHWLNQYFMLATTLAPLLAQKLDISYQNNTPWQVLQSRWETAGEGSLVWLLKTAPALASSSENFTQADWVTVTESCLSNTPLPEKLAHFIPAPLFQALKAWLFQRTVAQGWLPKPWIAPLYEVLFSHLQIINGGTFSGIAQQVKLLIFDDVQQVPLEELQPLLKAVGFKTTPVWLGVKTPPISLEANEADAEPLCYTQAIPPILTALQHWGWTYTLQDEWQPKTIEQRAVTPIQTALIGLLTAEYFPHDNPPSAKPPENIHRVSFVGETQLNEWLKLAVLPLAQAGQSVGVLVPSNKLKAVWQAQLLTAYAPLEAQWMRCLTLCLEGWHLAMQGREIENSLQFPWQENTQGQPLLSGWLWVEHPQWSDALQAWETEVLEAIQPFCNQQQWQAFWQASVAPCWQQKPSPSQWLSAWVKALFPLMTQRQSTFDWQRLYLPLLNELQSMEQRLSVAILSQTSQQLSAWLEAFFLPWTLPAKRSNTAQSENLPLVLTYQQAIGHQFDAVFCPNWYQLPDVKIGREEGFFDAVTPTATVQQWLPLSVINEVLGAWASAKNQLFLLESTPADEVIELSNSAEDSSKAVFLKQQLLHPVLEKRLGLYANPQANIPLSVAREEAAVLASFSALLPLSSGEQPLLNPAEKPLYLSVSGLEEYLKCPKRFYYSRVLRLPTEASDALLKGNLIHLIMEQFNLQATPETHTVAHLLAIAEHLLSVETHRHSPPIPAVLENEHYQAYVKQPRLLRFQLKQECLAGFENLQVQGYFSKPITHVQPELNLPDVELKGLAGVRFKMMLDAVLHHPDDSLTLVDYKAYGASRYSVSKAKSQEHLHSVLTPLPLLEAGETGFSKTEMEHRHYQLALYAYGLQDVSLTDAHQRLAKVGLQLVRPQREAMKFESGSIGLFLDATTVLDARQTVLESLKVSVVDRLKNDSHFLPNPDGGYCDACSFSAICPATQAASAEDD